MKFKVWLAAAILIAHPANTAERTGTEILFDTRQIEAVATGSVLTYTHDRHFATVGEMPPIEDGEIRVLVFEGDEGRLTKVTLENSIGKRSLEHFPADSGNPILITFLESTVQSVHRATKGSPFYIRNRMKDALATGGAKSENTVDGKTTTRIEYRPFENDKNRDKMMGYADLTLTFVVSSGTPGEFLELSAKTDDGETYSESIRYRGTKASE